MTIATGGGGKGAAAAALADGEYERVDSRGSRPRSAVQGMEPAPRGVPADVAPARARAQPQRRLHPRDLDEPAVPRGGEPRDRRPSRRLAAEARAEEGEGEGGGVGRRRRGRVAEEEGREAEVDRGGVQGAEGRQDRQGDQGARREGADVGAHHPRVRRAARDDEGGGGRRRVDAVHRRRHARLDGEDARRVGDVHRARPHGRRAGEDEGGEGRQGRRVEAARADARVVVGRRAPPRRGDRAALLSSAASGGLEKFGDWQPLKQAKGRRRGGNARARCRRAPRRSGTARAARTT